MESSLSFVQAIQNEIEPMLALEGFELVLLEHVSGPNILRVYIDRLHSDEVVPSHAKEGVTIDDCARVSRWLSDLMDAEGLSEKVPGHFTFEVSSPGLDRPLTKPAHFHRFMGADIKLMVRPGTISIFAERRRFNGKLQSADAEGIGFSFEGHQVRVLYQDILQARLIPEF